MVCGVVSDQCVLLGFDRCFHMMEGHLQVYALVLDVFAFRIVGIASRESDRWSSAAGFDLRNHLVV